MLFLFQNYHFKFPLFTSKVSPKSSNKDVSIIPPKAVLKAVSSKFLTKQPISVPTSHSCCYFVTLYFWYCLFLLISISAIFMLFPSQNYHFKFPLVSSKTAPNLPTRLYPRFPPKHYIRQYPLNSFLNSQAQFLLLILLLLCHLYIFGIVCS